VVTQQGYRVQGSKGANTKVVYDSVNGSYDVKGQQDNVKITIPAGLRTQSISATLSANSAIIGLDADANLLDGTLDVSELAALKVGMPVSGGGLPSNAYIKSISDGTVTLSHKAFTDSKSVSLATATGATGSNTINFTSTDALTVGMSIRGTGIPTGTTITAVNSPGVYEISNNLTANIPPVVVPPATVAPTQTQLQ